MSFVQRHRDAKVAREAELARREARKPVEDQRRATIALANARSFLIMAEEAVLSAQTEQQRREAALVQYRAATGLHARPAEIRDLKARIEIAADFVKAKTAELEQARDALSAVQPVKPKRGAAA